MLYVLLFDIVFNMLRNDCHAHIPAVNNENNAERSTLLQKAKKKQISNPYFICFFFV